MTKTREKLIKLIHYCTSCEECRDEDVADHLIAAGAVIPVRCGECRRWVPDDSRKDFGICYNCGHKGGIWKPANGYCDKGVPKSK